MTNVPEHFQTLLIQFERQTQTVLAGGFVLAVISELYPSVSKINTWILFTKHANDVTCLTSKGGSNL